VTSGDRTLRILVGIVLITVLAAAALAAGARIERPRADAEPHRMQQWDERDDHSTGSATIHTAASPLQIPAGPG
jgi:hypothetical protein